MRRVLLLTTLAGFAFPVPALATEYWGGPMGENLPVANITYRVKDDGAVKGVQVHVRVKCSLEGGGPAPNSQLVTGFPSPEPTSTGFAATQKHLFSGGSQRIEAEVVDSSATGVFEAQYRLEDVRSDRVRSCHTGVQPWKAKPISRKKWKRLRDYG